MKKNIKVYIISILIALTVGGLSALLTSGSMDIYNDIVRPPLAPASIVFPIAWTILYILMGISSALIYLSISQPADERINALFIYAVQLFLNFFWSIIFFNMRAFLFAFVWLVALWLVILLMIQKFKEINKTAAALMLPYLLWVSFAGYLNLAIFILNRG